MARGRGTSRNIAPERISELIRGNKDALQAQAAIGGNAGKTAQSEATKQAMTQAQPNNTQPLTAAEAQAEIAASEAAEKAFKDYLQSKQDKAQFESEEAAEKARQEAFERFIRGKQSAAGAANSASTPENAKKGKKDPKSTEPKGEEAEEAKAEKPWWMSSGSGPRFLFGGQGAGGEVQMSGGAIEARAEASAEGARELLKRRQARKAGGGATPPPSAPPTPPTK